MEVEHLRKDRVEIDYQIDMQSRFHCGSGYPFGLIDRMAVRDGKGYLFIPGSTIKGLLRENCEKILRMCRLEVVDPHDEKGTLLSYGRPNINDMIFGSRFQGGSLYFNNAVLSNEDRLFFDAQGEHQRYLHLQTTTRTQTAVSRLLGTVTHQALFNSEFGLPYMTFQGKIFGFLQGMDLGELEDLEGTDSLLLLLSGLSLLEKLGSDRTGGAGQCRVAIDRLRVNGKEEELFPYLEHLEFFTYFHDKRGG